MPTFDHITNASNVELAEMLQSIIAMRDTSGRCYFQNPQEAIEIVQECARRLRINSIETFNHEAFE